MQKHSKQNKGYKYILTVYDNFSKFAWAIPTKNKSAISLKEAFTELFSRGRKPTKLWFDKESGIYSKDFREFLNKNEVKLYSTESDLKAVFVERFNRTLENKLYPIMTYRGVQIWYDVLDHEMEKYNNTRQRTIKMTPTEGSLPENSKQISALLSVDNRVLPGPKLKVGDIVRISKIKSIFGKGYTINWSYELFEISEVMATKPVTYRITAEPLSPKGGIVDERGEKILGMFYESELQKSMLKFGEQLRN